MHGTFPGWSLHCLLARSDQITLHRAAAAETKKAKAWSAYVYVEAEDESLLDNPWEGKLD